MYDVYLQSETSGVFSPHWTVNTEDDVLKIERNALDTMKDVSVHHDAIIMYREVDFGTVRVPDADEVIAEITQYLKTMHEGQGLS